MKQTKPNFIIAGGVATGTSFLSAALSKHPEIYLPKIQRPEPNFFHYTHKYENGLDWYLQKWFHQVGHEKAIGERSSLLLPSQTAPDRLKANYPNIKIIFCLRNPIERTWANYRFTVLEGLESLPFNDALDQEKHRMSIAQDTWAEVQPHAYLTRSQYSVSLKKYLKLFNQDQILMLKSEALGKEPHLHLRSVCNFLGVDPNIKMTLPPNYSSPSVLDQKEQMSVREHFKDRFPEVVESIRREEPLISNDQQDQIFFNKLKSNLTNGKNPLPDDSRDKLQHLLKAELKELKSLVPFSIDDWK
jgi:hypothetical protein